jgi:hypothetical protein
VYGSRDVAAKRKEAGKSSDSSYNVRSNVNENGSRRGRRQVKDGQRINSSRTAKMKRWRRQGWKRKGESAGMHFALLTLVVWRCRRDGVPPPTLDIGNLQLFPKFPGDEDELLHDMTGGTARPDSLHSPPWMKVVDLSQACILSVGVL